MQFYLILGNRILYTTSTNFSCAWSFFLADINQTHFTVHFSFYNEMKFILKDHFLLIYQHFYKMFMKNSIYDSMRIIIIHHEITGHVQDRGYFVKKYHQRILSKKSSNKLSPCIVIKYHLDTTRQFDCSKNFGSKTYN